MGEENRAASDEKLVLTADILAAFVVNHAISANDLPGPIGSVYAALGDLDRPVNVPPTELVPAVPIKKSVTPDFIVCLDDGKKFKSMKRHLAGLGMTPISTVQSGGCLRTTQWLLRTTRQRDQFSPSATN